MLIFKWPLMQFVPSMAIFGLSIIIGNFILCLCLSVSWWVLFSYTTKRFAPGIILHFLWWHGFTAGVIDESYSMPDALKREFF